MRESDIGGVALDEGGGPGQVGGGVAGRGRKSRRPIPKRAGEGPQTAGIERSHCRARFFGCPAIEAREGGAHPPHREGDLGEVEGVT